MKYKWIAYNNDKTYEDSSTKLFDTQEECYNDMRKHAIEKIYCNTYYNDVIDDCMPYEEGGLTKTMGDLGAMGENWCIGYRVEFHPHKIQHTSYSGIYNWEIQTVDPKKYVIETKYTMTIDADTLEEAKEKAMEDLYNRKGLGGNWVWNEDVNNIEGRN